MTNQFWFLVCSGLMIMALLWFQPWKWLASASREPTDKYSTLVVAKRSLKVEVARTPEEIRQGLSDRDEIGADGMLFVFSQRSPQVFWMYQMRFGLDMVWFDQGKIVKIDANIPPPKETQGLPATVPSNTSVEAVLEVPAGTAERYNWKVGDTVEGPALQR